MPHQQWFVRLGSWAFWNVRLSERTGDVDFFHQTRGAVRSSVLRRGKLSRELVGQFVGLCFWTPCPLQGKGDLAESPLQRR